MKTTAEELGVHEEIASFVLPLGMTVNMAVMPKKYISRILLRLYVRCYIFNNRMPVWVML